MALDSNKTRLCGAAELHPPAGHARGAEQRPEPSARDDGVNSGTGSGVDHLATRLREGNCTDQVQHHPRRGPFARGRASQSGPKIKNKIKKRQSHDLFDAVTLEAAGASLLLHLAGGAVAHPPAVGVAGGGRELHVLLVNPWGVLGSGK